MKIRVLILCVLLFPSAQTHAATDLTIAEMSVDGVKVRKLQCQLGGKSVLGSLLLTTFLAANKPAFRSCGLHEKEVTLEWDWTAGQVNRVHVVAPADAAVERCLGQGLHNKAIDGSGHCRGFVSVPE